MKIGGVHHVALLVRDVERVAAFYRDVLGMPELRRHLHEDGSLRSIWLGLGEGPAFLAVEPAAVGAARAVAQAPGWLVLALHIPAGARAEVRARLEAHGVQLERESRWTLYFKDPEGNAVALSHHPEDAP